jgi:hypothetical protein
VASGCGSVVSPRIGRRLGSPPREQQPRTHILGPMRALVSVVEQKNRTLVEMVRTMLDEHRTPRCFWAVAISTACYISNRIFLRSILNLTPFALHFGRKLSVSHLRPFGCKCFILKCGNLDKFECRSSDSILLGYTPHGRSYIVFNLETNTVVES